MPSKITLSLLVLFLSSISLPTFANNSKHADANGEYVRKAFLARMKKPFIENGKKKALIIGDSHAQDFFNGILENHFLENYQVSTRYIPTRCQIYWGKDMYRFTKKSDLELCQHSDNLRLAQPQISEADLIILVASWREWSANALPQTLRHLKISAKQKLFIIGGKSFGNISPERYIKTPKAERPKLFHQASDKQIRINEFLKNNLHPNNYINLYQLLCGKNYHCPIFTPNSKLISFDGGHLSPAGAKYISAVIFKGSALGFNN